MFESFPVDRLPKSLKDFLRTFAGIRTGTVWMSSPPAIGVTAVSNSDEVVNAVMFNLDEGRMEFSVVRPKLNPFTSGDWRAEVGRQERERFLVAPNQVFIRVSSGRTTHAHLFVLPETRVLYFDLGGAVAASSLTEAEKYALAVMAYKAAYRNEKVRQLIVQGLDMDAAFASLVEKKLIKRSASGALTLTADGRMVKSERDVQALAWRM